MEGKSRRDFLKILGGSAAAAIGGSIVSGPAHALEEKKEDPVVVEYKKIIDSLYSKIAHNTELMQAYEKISDENLVAYNNGESFKIPGYGFIVGSEDTLAKEAMGTGALVGAALVGGAGVIAHAQDGFTPEDTKEVAGATGIAAGVGAALGAGVSLLSASGYIPDFFQKTAKNKGTVEKQDVMKEVSRLQGSTEEVQSTIKMLEAEIKRRQEYNASYQK